jgi:HSP20 family protein
MPAEEKDLFAEMDVLSAEMERLFYRLFHPKLALKTPGEPTWQPLTDIHETGDSFVVTMDLAGVKREDVTIELERDRLCVRGVRREQPCEDVKAYHQVEINYGRFERVLLLRAAISREAVSACFEDGFLRITIPKALPGQHVTRIEILREEE